MLIDSSLSVADTIYEADWEMIVDHKVKKCILLLLKCSQIPKCLTARGFAVVSVALFTSVSIIQKNKYFRTDYIFNIFNLDIQHWIFIFFPFETAL